MGDPEKVEGEDSKWQLSAELKKKWPVPSRPLVSQLEERLPGSSWPPRPPGSPPPPPVESRSPTDTGPAPWLSVRSGDTRSPPSCSSASCPSSVSSGRLPRISKLISGSSLPPSALCRRLARPTWSVCSRTPTCAPSTPSVSPSCPRTSSWPGGSVAREPKLLDQSGSIRESLTTLGTPCGPSVTAPPPACVLKFSNPCALTFLSIAHLYT